MFRPRGCQLPKPCESFIACLFEATHLLEVLVPLQKPPDGQAFKNSMLFVLSTLLHSFVHQSIFGLHDCKLGYACQQQVCDAKATKEQ